MGGVVFCAGAVINGLSFPSTPLTAGGVLTIVGTGFGGDVNAVSVNDVAGQIVNQTTTQVRDWFL